MGKLIAFRPRRQARRYIGAALCGVIADASAIEQAMARLTFGATVLGIVLGVAFQVLA
jgi:hypothetical protein